VVDKTLGTYNDKYVSNSYFSPQHCLKANRTFQHTSGECGMVLSAS